jgi:hypothetical protein
MHCLPRQEYFAVTKFPCVLTCRWFRGDKVPYMVHGFGGGTSLAYGARVTDLQNFFTEVISRSSKWANLHLRGSLCLYKYRSIQCSYWNWYNFTFFIIHGVKQSALCLDRLGVRSSSLLSSSSKSGNGYPPGASLFSGTSTLLQSGRPLEWERKGRGEVNPNIRKSICLKTIEQEKFE